MDIEVDGGKGSQRFTHLADEAKYIWLPALLDVYHIVDMGISTELQEEERKRNAKVACHPGCSNCCRRPMVPMILLEFLGISWFASEKLEGDTRSVVKEQLLHHKQTPQCPFLVESRCSIYPMRPLACREFFMFGAPCGIDEHVELTRPNDIWTHSRDIARRVAMVILPFYGINDERQKVEAFENGYIGAVSKPMHELPLGRIASLML